jgi:hypothetical protein
MFDKPRTLCILFLSGLAAAIASGQAITTLDASQLESELVAPWLLSVNGEPQKRSLQIASVREVDSGVYRLEATYGLVDARRGRIQLESKTSPAGLVLRFSTPMARFEATRQTDGSFAGTITYNNGVSKPMQIRKVASDSMAGPASQEQTVASKPQAADMAKPIAPGTLVLPMTWNYRAYSNGKPYGMMYFTLDEKSGEYIFQVASSASMDSCYRSPMKAVVIGDEATLTITPIFPMNGCGDARFVVKTDGSGGIRENKEGGVWRPDGLDRVMTLKR